MDVVPVLEDLHSDDHTCWTKDSTVVSAVIANINTY